MTHWPEERPSRNEIETEEQVIRLRGLLLELADELEHHGLLLWAQRIRDDLKEMT